MAASNLIIHTGDYFNLDDIHYVLIAYIAKPTWSSVSSFNVSDFRSLSKNNTINNGKISQWIYNTDIEKDISFKFNVIALFKENSKDNFDENNNIINNIPISKSLLAYGSYDASQLVSISEDWTINISSNWIFKEGSVDFSTDFELLYNKHVINTNPINGLSVLHNKLVDSNALPTNNSVNNIVSSYQNRGNKNQTESTEINGIYGLNIIKYDYLDKKLLDASELKSNESVQTLVVNRLGTSYSDIISIYEYDNMDVLENSYVTHRLTKDNYK